METPGCDLGDHGSYAMKSENNLEFVGNEEDAEKCEAETSENVFVEISEKNPAAAKISNQTFLRKSIIMKNFNTFEPPGQFFLIHGDYDRVDTANQLIDPNLHCPVCSREVPNKSFLHKHVIGTHPTHYGIYQVISCAQCKKKFETLSEMDDHWISKKCKPLELEADKQWLGCRFCMKFVNKGEEVVLWHEATNHSRAFLRKKLQCCFCLNHFSTFKQYQKHIIFRECLNVCTGCSEVYGNLNFLVEHINKKHTTNVHINCLSCVNCLTKFDSLDEKFGHICQMQCNHCDISFTSYSLFYNHIYEVHRKTGHRCTICDGIFLETSKYKLHLENQRCRKCQFCQLLCKNKFELMAHICPIQPLPRVTYSIHAPVPEKEKPARPLQDGDTWCTFCNNIFSQSAEFNAHLLGDGCLGCRLCGFVADDETRVLDHVLKEHKQNLYVSAEEEVFDKEAMQCQNTPFMDGDVSDIVFFCSSCDQVVTSKEELEEIHKVWIECIQCKAKLQCKICYVKHVANEHSAICKICNLYFDFEKLHRMKRHGSGQMNIPMEQPLYLFTCSQCCLNAFDKLVLMAKTDKCQHVGSLWKFKM